VRKTKRSDTVAKPDVTIEMAEPIKKEEEDDGARNRTRQLTVEEVPFEFLSQQQKDEVLKEQALREMTETLEKIKDHENSKKAKVLLGLVIGAGLGMFAAYLVKKNLFSVTVEAALEAVDDIVDKSQ
jgi:deoxyhypusine synthase